MGDILLDYYLAYNSSWNMLAIEAYKPLGALSAVILFAGLFYIVNKWPQGKHITYSQRIATSKQGIIYYILLFSLVLPLLILFFVKWFIPAFNLSPWFGFFVFASSLSQYLCTLIPEVGGRKSRYHRFFAFSSALLLRSEEHT